MCVFKDIITKCQKMYVKACHRVRRNGIKSLLSIPMTVSENTICLILVNKTNIIYNVNMTKIQCGIKDFNNTINFLVLMNDTLSLKLLNINDAY